MVVAARRLRRDRGALAFGVLFVLLAAAFLAAPLYASAVAGPDLDASRMLDLTWSFPVLVGFLLASPMTLRGIEVGTLQGPGLDLPAIVAMAIYLALVVTLASAIVDVIVGAIDPRVRSAGLPAP